MKRIKLSLYKLKSNEKDIEGVVKDGLGLKYRMICEFEDIYISYDVIKSMNVKELEENFIKYLNEKVIIEKGCSNFGKKIVKEMINMIINDTHCHSNIELIIKNNKIYTRKLEFKEYYNCDICVFHK